jgi:hypothetical protein
MLENGQGSRKEIVAQARENGRAGRDCMSNKQELNIFTIFLASTHVKA